MINKYHHAHKAFAEKGFFTLPANAEKRPIVKGWPDLRMGDEVPESVWKNAEALCLPCEANGMEVVDVDVKNDPRLMIGKDLLRTLEASFYGYEDLVIAGTPSGGFHIIYRTDHAESNQKLARTEGGEVIVETRGNRGQIIVAPSEGYHMYQGDFNEIPTLEKEEREELLEICRSFNRYEKKNSTAVTKHKRNPRSEDSSVFEKYNEEFDVQSYLENYGYTYVDHTEHGARMLRPGDSKAQYSLIIYSDSNRVYVYSSSCTPLEQEESYSAIDLRILLEGKTQRVIYAEILTEMRVPEDQFEEIGSGDFDHMSFYLPDIPPYEDEKGNVKRPPLTPYYIAQTLRSHGFRMRLNTVTSSYECYNKLTKKWTLFEDEDLNEIYRILSYGHTVRLSDIKSIVFSRQLVEVSNPIREYWDELPAWDGVDRMPSLMEAIGPKNPETAELYMRRWLRGVIECSRGEGETNEIALTFFGSQGAGKDRFAESLAPKALREYYRINEMGSSNNRDNMKMLSSALILNIPEAEIILANKKTVESFKAMMSVATISQRKLHSNGLENAARVASIVMSANDRGLLVDMTGNRRIAVIETDKLDYNHTINMEQMYAQILQQEKIWWFTREEIQKMEIDQEGYQAPSYEEEALEQDFDFFRDQELPDGFKWNATSVKKYLEYAHGIKVPQPRVLGRLLTKLAGAPIVVSYSGNKMRTYSMMITEDAKMRYESMHLENPGRFPQIWPIDSTPVKQELPF